MVTSDLTSEGNDELAGYWGGFSGDVDGQALGFLSPHFNGADFHGKAVQVYYPSDGFIRVARVFSS